MTIRTVFAIALLLGSAAGASAQTTVKAASRAASPQTAAKRPVKTVTYNHQDLVLERPGSAVLKLKNGEHFAVEFKNTDPRRFRYDVSAVVEEEKQSSAFSVLGGAPTKPEDLKIISVAMRHSDAFRRYRISATPTAPAISQEALQNAADALKTDLKTFSMQKDNYDAAVRMAQREKKEGEIVLEGFSFDLWVETDEGWSLTFNGGTAFSGLRSPQYYVKTDGRGTEDAKDDTKTVEEDNSNRDSFRPDLIAAANLLFPGRTGLGLQFAVGMNNDADPKYFFGPSVRIGSRFTIAAGIMGGRIDRLPTGQATGRPPLNGDNTLADLPKRFSRSGFVAVSFSFVDRKDQFIGAFGSSKKGDEK